MHTRTSSPRARTRRRHAHIAATAHGGARQGLRENRLILQRINRRQGAIRSHSSVGWPRRRQSDDGVPFPDEAEDVQRVRVRVVQMSDRGLEGCLTEP